jgi:hypothetical protein
VVLYHLCRIFTAGSDYNGTVGPGVFTFSSDVSIHSYKLPLINDSTFEISESLTASLSFAGPMPLLVSIGPDTANIIIENEDCKYFRTVCISFAINFMHLLPGSLVALEQSFTTAGGMHYYGRPDAAPP